MRNANHLKVDSRFFILLLGGLAATAPLGVDMYLPALPAIAADLGVAISRIQQTLSVFMLGFALSQLLYGPLSDRFGRKPLMLFGLALFLVASLLCAGAENDRLLIGWRLLQALGGGAASVVVTAVVRDLYRGTEAARMMSLVIMAMTLAPLLAPLVGGQVLLWLGWRAIFYLLALLALLLGLLVWFKLPETLAAPRSLAPGPLLSAYGEVLRHRRAMGHLLCAVFAFAGMFAFITGSPFVYIQYYGVSEQAYGLLFGSNILMMMALNWLNSRVIVRVGLARMIRRATLVQASAGLALVPVALGGWGGLWGLFPLLVLFVGMIGLLGANTTAGLLTPFGRQAGSASALLGTARFLFGALASALVGWLHNGTPLPMVSVIAACGLLAALSYRLLVTGGDAEGD